MTSIRSSTPFADETRDPLIDRDRRRAIIGFPPGARGRYVAVDAEDELIVLPLARPVTVLGRGLACDIRFDDPTLSRRHALIIDRDGTAVLADERSTNGTWLNGRRVTEAVLRHGDTIVLGDICLEYLEHGLDHPAGRPSARRWVGASPGAPTRSVESTADADTIATQPPRISRDGP
jgi:hypothetical protein